MSFSFAYSSATGSAPILGRAKYRRRGRRSRRVTARVYTRCRVHATPTARPGSVAVAASGPERVRRDPVREDLPIQRLGIDAEDRGRLRAVAADLLERGDDVEPLHLLQASARRR